MIGSVPENASRQRRQDGERVVTWVDAAEELVTEGELPAKCGLIKSPGE